MKQGRKIEIYGKLIPSCSRQETQSVSILLDSEVPVETARSNGEDSAWWKSMNAWRQLREDIKYYFAELVHKLRI